MSAEKNMRLTDSDREAIAKHSATALAVICIEQQTGEPYFGVNIADHEDTGGPLLFDNEFEAEADARQWAEEAKATVVRVRVTVEEVRQ